MKTFARIQDGRVAEVFASSQDPRDLFHPALEWQIVPSDISPRLRVNWSYADGGFSPPQPPSSPDQPPTTLASLQAEIDTLRKIVVALAPRG